MAHRGRTCGEGVKERMRKRSLLSCPNPLIYLALVLGTSQSTHLPQLQSPPTALAHPSRSCTGQGGACRPAPPLGPPHPPAPTALTPLALALGKGQSTHLHPPFYSPPSCPNTTHPPPSGGLPAPTLCGPVPPAPSFLPYPHPRQHPPISLLYCAGGPSAPTLCGPAPPAPSFFLVPTPDTTHPSRSCIGQGAHLHLPFLPPSLLPWPHLTISPLYWSGGLPTSSHPHVALLPP